MHTSEAIDLLAGALVKAQAEMKNPPLDGVNPHFKSRFATLAAVREAVLPALVRHGLSFVQNPGTSERGPTLTTRLLHISGQWLETDPLCLAPARPDPQSACAALTYMRRYSLMALLGVVGDDDDDGEAASKPAAPAKEKANGHKAAAPAPKKEPPPPPQDGAELDARLSAYDLKVSEAGLCERGAVVEHVVTLGVKNGQPKEFVRWSAGWLAWGMEQAKRFVAECKAGKGPVRAPAPALAPTPAG